MSTAIFDSCPKCGGIVLDGRTCEACAMKRRMKVHEFAAVEPGQRSLDEFAA